MAQACYIWEQGIYNKVNFYLTIDRFDFPVFKYLNLISKVIPLNTLRGQQ